MYIYLSYLEKIKYGLTFYMSKMYPSMKEWHDLHKKHQLVKPTIAQRVWLPPQLTSKFSGLKRTTGMTTDHCCNSFFFNDKLTYIEFQFA